MKIAVILDQPLAIGGGFQQALSTALLLLRHQNDPHEFVFLTTVQENIEVLRQHGIAASALHFPASAHVIVRCRKDPVLRRLTSWIKNPLDRALDELNIDLVLFTTSSMLCTASERYHYIMTVLDLSHRDTPEFHEAYDNNEFENREALYRDGTTRAVAVIVDSEHSRDSLARRYGTDRERIHVIPFRPGEELRGTATATLDQLRKELPAVGEAPFIFYPAQFWSHKNHAYILRGLAVLEREFGVRLNAVFTGSDRGNRGFVNQLAKELGLASRVICPGFVSGSVIAALYQNAVALVMPTWFGPTNIPPLEAFQLGCPVLYSDLPGLRDQVGDAALLMNLADPKSLASHLSNLLNDKALRETLVSRGHEKIKQWMASDPWETYLGIFTAYELRRRAWTRK